MKFNKNYNSKLQVCAQQAHIHSANESADSHAAQVSYRCFYITVKQMTQILEHELKMYSIVYAMFSTGHSSPSVPVRKFRSIGHFCPYSLRNKITINQKISYFYTNIKQRDNKLKTHISECLEN